MKKTLMLSVILASAFATSAMAQNKPSNMDKCGYIAERFSVVLQARAENIPAYELINTMREMREVDDAQLKFSIFLVRAGYSVKDRLVNTVHGRAEAANAFYLGCINGSK